MWGGRFAGGPAALMREINASIALRQAAVARGHRRQPAHAAMLATRASSPEDAAAIDEGLDRDRRRI
jgi:argininosuccinate lyase